MSLAIFPRPVARLTTRPSRDGLYTLASAWHASNDSNVRPFARPAAPAAADATPVADAAEPPPYWPDGPSAA
ncbi:MAG: hypothetical protein ABIT71_09845 [Vicinamibacteraceae bacterium]